MINQGFQNRNFSITMVKKVENREWYHKIEKDVPAGGLLPRALDAHDTVTDWAMRSECLLRYNGMELAQVMNYARL